MFNAQKLHSFIQNYITIIAQILFECKSYVLHIKASQVKKIHHFYISNFFSCHLYFLKPTEFARTFLTIFTLILVKFHNIVSLYPMVNPPLETPLQVLSFL